MGSSFMDIISYCLRRSLALPGIEIRLESTEDLGTPAVPRASLIVDALAKLYEQLD